MLCRFMIPFLVMFIGSQSSFAAEDEPLLLKTKKAPPVVAGSDKPSPMNVLSIIPAQGEPGATVTLFGTGFSEQTTAFLGSNELATNVASPMQLAFEIPKLKPGLYALFLKREDGKTSKPYNFTITPQKPVALSLNPDSLASCASGRDREVTITGRNFQEGSQVLLDGAAIPSRFSSAESFSFNIPRIVGGLHQVQVRNPEETISGALSLMIDNRPEITGVMRGEEYVNYYNLVIDGINFQQNSALVVMEERSIEEGNSRLAGSIKRVTTLSANAIEREQIIFLNCNRIVYQRYPYSSTPKSFRIQIVNPGESGESSVVSVSAP